MKRVVYLKEFAKELAAFGLGNAIKTNPEVCKSLFVTESQGNDAVDANDLFSILVHNTPLKEAQGEKMKRQ